jgi:predicted DNA-binding transcriptional regulator AlpA
LNPSNEHQPTPNTDLVLTKLASSMVDAVDSLKRLSDTQSQTQKPSAPRRGLSRTEAAGYVGVSPTTFDSMVRSKTMPRPVRIGSRTVWDLHALNEAFDALVGPADGNPWDAWG